MGQFVRRIVFSSQTLTSHTKSKCLLNRLRPLLLLRPRLRPRKFPTRRWPRQLRKLKLKPTPPRPKREQKQKLLPRRHPKRQQKRKWKKKVQKRLPNNKESNYFPPTFTLRYHPEPYQIFIFCTPVQFSRWHFCSLVVLQSDLPFVTKDLIKDSMKITRCFTKNRTNYFSRHNS